MDKNEEIKHVRSQLKEEREKNRRLRKNLSESEKNIDRIEGYLTFLTGESPKKRRKKTIPDHIEDILKRNKKPMKVKDILYELIKIEGLEHTAEQTVAGALIRYVNKKERFHRPAPNSYTLLKKKGNN